MSFNQMLGQWAEQQAQTYLEQHSFKMLQRNYHSRFGEIDLIMTRQDELIFVEVKARQPNAWGRATEVITLAKQRKIMHTALVFLQQYPQFNLYALRFDVVCIDFLQPLAKIPQQSFLGSAYDLAWIENAFTFDTNLIRL
ncbi:YraN family protein [Acinetobacter sp. B51(2017)]|uniref:YraN family protein n=1 Tax=Acinetobacter sp. B51(2017) TaxID=2060938 RepID=UPI000F08F873|nr:YraN family protein [Acinetobacter sp. B51(2017)]